MQVMKKILFLILINFLLSAAAAERIVSLSPALTELVCKLGCEKQLIGRSDVCNFPESIKKLPVAGRFADPDIERIIRMKPTLLIVNDLINPNVRKTFEKCGIKTMLMQCRNIEEYSQCVRKLSRILNAEEAGNAELERIENKLKQKYKPLNLKVLWVIWDAPLMVAGKNSLPDSLIQLAGAENVATSVGQAYFKCSFDYLLEQKIDVIIWTASPNGWKRHRFWKNLAAVKQNKIIFDLDHDLIQRPGPRIFEGIKILREKLEKQ